MIELEDLCVTIDDFRLEKITLSIAPGEYVVLLGPSGAGKTVLLETIAGIREPDHGKISINGKEMNDIPPEHRGVALVYQDYSLFPHMTVGENVEYGIKMHRIDPGTYQGRIERLLSDLGISSLRDRYPGSLSGGEQQRVAMARVLATRPSVLLLDEPFASLDPQSRNECIRMMQDLRDRRSITIVQVSHFRDDAYALADRSVVLISGRIAQTGRTDEIFRSPESRNVAEFTGMENILSGVVLDSGSGHSYLSTGIGSVLIPVVFPRGLQLSIGIPAECITIVASESVPDAPGKNILECLVRRVMCGRDTIIFHLDGPVPLASAIQRSDETAAKIQPGNRVFALFHPSDVLVFSGD